MMCRIACSISLALASSDRSLSTSSWKFGARMEMGAVDALEHLHGCSMAGLEPRQLIGQRHERAGDLLLVEDGEGVLQDRRHAVVVDDETVALLLVRPVHARDRLEKVVLLQRAVEVHHLLDG